MIEVNNSSYKKKIRLDPDLTRVKPLLEDFLMEYLCSLFPPEELVEVLALCLLLGPLVPPCG